MSKIALKTSLCVLIAVTAGAGIWAAMVPSSGATYTAAVKTAVVLRRAILFPRLAWHSDRRCTLRDAWRIACARPERVESTQIASEGPYALMEVAGERFWIPARDLPTLAEMIQEQKKDIYAVETSHGIRSGDVVLDCGANIGVFTRHALRAGAKLVVAIEPGPDALHCFRRNLAAEILDGRVVVYPKGVWDKDAVLELTTNDSLASTANSVAINRGARGVKVALTTIDKLVAELSLAKVDFIKMDIEGAEPQALAGARRTVERFRPRMAIALEHHAGDPKEISALVNRMWPTLAARCGPCGWVRNPSDHLQPELLFVAP